MKICENYALLLDQFLDGELSKEDEALMREHLVSCPACAAYVADAMAIRAAFEDLDEIEVPEGLSDGVMAVIRAHAAPRKKNHRWMKAAASLAACAAIVFAAVRIIPFGASSGTSAASAESAPMEARAGDVTDGVESPAEARQQLTADSEMSDPLSSSNMESGQNSAPVSVEPFALAPNSAQDSGSGKAPKTAVGPMLSANLNSDAASYRKWANLTAAAVGTELDGYSGIPRQDDAGRSYTAYELSESEFDALIARLGAEDKVTAYDTSDSTLYLIAVYP
ncbi:MAG: zf-HC2 domain-containing protein [Oscillibacter ruminantium]|uniref:anti-sigma factor family protein n=1 Tax=Oscillibacter ruminantium TaxID=1263547 RepID=UPI002B218035|nr:zf-HC2 domain-containing protein [Oscillibacter ruminantium]MEA5042379.1 zf-HC2 domain-containing protein [Oscillibacter ruminantium]